MTNSFAAGFSWVALHWWILLIAGAVGIAATCTWCVETDEARAKRAERNRKKELRRLAGKISIYGRNVHQRYPTGDVVVSEHDLAEQFRQRPDAVATALHILLDEQKVQKAPLNGAPRFCVQRMVNCSPFGASAMNPRGLGTDRLRLKLRIMSDDDLWWLLLNHGEECSHEFWEEVEIRKAAGTLSKGSPFWTMSKLTRYRQPGDSGGNSNLIELTRKEWEARRRRKMFRVISA
jgi:hypothetical protein